MGRSVWRDLRKNLRAAERERENARDKSKLLVRQAGEDKAVVREVRERERNARAKAAGGINKDMSKLGKELEMARDEAGMDGVALTSDEAKAHRLASETDGVRERSEGGKDDYRAATNRDKAVLGRERADIKRLYNRPEEEEG